MSQIAKVRLFHNADKSKLVREDSEEASFLFANTGDEIPDSACELYGLVDGDLPAAKLTAAEKKAAAEAEKKAAAEAEEAKKKAAAEAEEAKKKAAAEAAEAKKKEGASMDDKNNDGAGTGDAAASAGDDASKAAPQGDDKAGDQGADKAIKPPANKAAK